MKCFNSGVLQIKNGIAGLSVLVLSTLISAAVADPVTAPTVPAAAASAGTPTQPSVPEAQIPFANHGGIYNWQVVDERTILIQSQNLKWYKATLLGTCFDLPFANRLRFKSNADGSFDRFSSIKVHHQNCPLTSLVETTPPPKKIKAQKPNDAAAAAPNAAPSRPQ